MNIEQTMPTLDLEPIRLELRDILAKPPIRWGRGDAQVLIEQRIPLLLSEIDRLRQAANYHFDQAVQARQRAIDAETPSPVPEADQRQEEWRCFHCGMVLTTEQSAREHFGPTRHDIRACDALTHPAVLQLKFLHWHAIKNWRDTLSDVVDACYTEGSSSAWRLCGVCETEHHRGATVGDQTHTKGCAVDDAERLLRSWQTTLSASRTSEPDSHKSETTKI